MRNICNGVIDTHRLRRGSCCYCVGSAHSCCKRSGCASSTRVLWGYTDITVLACSSSCYSNGSRSSTSSDDPSRGNAPVVSCCIGNCSNAVILGSLSRALCGRSCNGSRLCGWKTNCNSNCNISRILNWTTGSSSSSESCSCS